MATGLSRKEAKLRATANAETLVELAAQTHPQETIDPSAITTDSSTKPGESQADMAKRAAEEKRRKFKEMMEAARTDKVSKPVSPLKLLTATIKPALSVSVRFLLGAGVWLALPYGQTKIKSLVNNAFNRYRRLSPNQSMMLRPK